MAPKTIQDAGGVFPVKTCEVKFDLDLKQIKWFDAGLPMYEEVHQQVRIFALLLFAERLVGSCGKEYATLCKGVCQSFAWPSNESL